MGYRQRTDGRIAVTIDSCVWNLFYEMNLDLSVELPTDRFALFIPREVEIELAAIPDRPEKADLKAYIRKEIEHGGITTTAVFGFAHADGGPERHGGFGSVTFQSDEDRAYYAAISKRFFQNRRIKGSQLTHNEGDAALGAASLSSVVLTRDTTTGPLSVAPEHGGKVLDLTGFSSSGKSLSELILEIYDKH